MEPGSMKKAREQSLIRGRGSGEDQLHQQHVGDGAARHGEQHLSLPFVQGDHRQYGDQLRQAVAA